MKTTLDIPDTLINSAMKETGCRTKTAAIIKALEQMIRQSKMAKLRSLRGSMPDLKIDIDTLRSRV